jgi:hypothetical protein
LSRLLPCDTGRRPPTPFPFSHKKTMSVTLLALTWDVYGWWSRPSLADLRRLRASGNQPGWYGLGNTAQPFFASGATITAEAIAAGMPVAAASAGRITTPAMLLDDDAF